MDELITILLVLVHTIIKSFSSFSNILKFKYFAVEINVLQRQILLYRIIALPSVLFSEALYERTGTLH